MYAIIVNGVIEQYCEEPWYVTREETIEGEERWVHVDNIDSAQAVSVHGNLYNLPFKPNAVKGAKTAVVTKKPSGDFIYENRTNIQKTDAKLDETKADIEDALCDTDIIMKERISMIEDALCDIDTLMNGGND